MPSVISHPNSAHQAACYSALNTWQQAMTAGGNTNQATAKAADIAFYRALVSSCRVNSIESGQFRAAFAELGTGGI